jgi:hypothetical protein
MNRLVVQLPCDRSTAGQIFFKSDSGALLAGPFVIAGRSTSALAGAHRNQRRDPQLPYGDTPTGTFAVREVVRTGHNTPFPKTEFGACGLLILEPLTGDAALADANGRFRFAIQGGNPGPDGSLRSTAGSLRMRNDDLRALICALARNPCARCEIMSAESAGAEAILDDSSCALVDPLPLPRAANRSAAAVSGVHLPRRGTVLMAMGASFVAQGAVHAAPLHPAMTAPSKVPAPRNVTWFAMAAAAADPQAYNPPPTEQTQQQQAPPERVNCQNNCEHGSAIQQVQGMGSGQMNTGAFDGNQGGRSTLDENAAGGAVNVPAVSSGTSVQGGAAPGPAPAPAQAQPQPSAGQTPAPPQSPPPAVSQPAPAPQTPPPAATTAPTAQQISDEENRKERERQKSKTKGAPIVVPPPPPSNERG